MKRTLVCLLIIMLTILTFPAIAESSALNESYGVWKKGNYIDEFREQTGKHFVFAETTGLFSNQATTDSDLTAKLLIDIDSVAFMLYEYNDYLVKGIYDIEKFTVSMKGDEYDEKFTLSAYIQEGQDRIFLASKEDEGEFYRAFTVNPTGKMRFVITSEKNPAIEYFFVLDDISGFYDACADYLAFYGIEIAKQYGIEVGTAITHKTLGEGTVVKVYSHYIAGNNYSHCPMIDIQFSDGTVKKGFVIPSVIEKGFITVN